MITLSARKKEILYTMAGVDEAFFFLHGLLISLSLFGVLKLKRSSAVITFTLIVLFFSNFFFQKQWRFLNLPATTGSHYITAFMLLFFLFCEKEGKVQAIYTLGIVFFCATFLLFCMHIHLLYLPAACDSIEWALRETFSNTLLLFPLSLAALFPLQFAGLHLWAAMRKRHISMTISALILVSALQLADTIVFLAIAKTVSLKWISGLYLSKIFVLAIFTPIITYFEKTTSVSCKSNE